MSIQTDYAVAYPNMEQFLSVTGRQKFILPLYAAMMKTGKAAMAQQLYKKYRANYHPLAQGKLDKMVH